MIISSTVALHAGLRLFAGTMASYGASLGIGYNGIYFVVEAGMDNNIVDGFQSSGNIPSIDKIDLSGSYVTVGIMYDGVKVTSK